MSAPIALLALAPTLSAAQTAAPDLLQPSLQGNPNNPPSFAPPGSAAPPANQTPPSNQFTQAQVPAPALTAPPVYGSPTGFGAGDTGFDSSNAGKRKRVAQQDQGSVIAPATTTTFDPVPPPPPQVSSIPPTLPPPLPPEVYPAKAAARPGATLPPPPTELPISNPPAVVYPLAAANRPGAVLPIPAAELFQGSASTPPPGTPPLNTLPLGAVPHNTLPLAAGDPYDPIGIRAGSFIVLPAVELSAGFNNNPQRVPGGAGSAYYVVAPELHAHSDWSANSLTADIIGSYTGYQNDTFQPSLNAPYLSAKVDGTLDVTRDTKILLEARSIVSTTNPGSPNLPAGLAKLPVETTLGGTAGVDEQFGRLDVTLKGTIDRSVFANSELTDGETANNDWQNYDQYAGIMRVGYELYTGFKPFVEASGDTRIYDSPVDVFGETRNSDGASIKGGAALDFTGWLTGEMAVGYLQRTYSDSIFPGISGMTVDGSLLWQMTPLTSAKFTAASEVNESILQGVSGSLSRDVAVEVDHALRTWLVASAQAGYGNDDYVGLGRDDNRYFAAGGLTYKFNREMQLKGTVREDWLTSNVSGVTNAATSVLLTLRLQK